MSDRIQIVNESDEIITHKERDVLELDKDIYRVSALWITNHNDEVLLAQRSFKKNNAPGKWGPAVAGTVEENESYESNIYKEAEEEIGLTGEKFVLGPKVFIDGPRRYFAQWFIAVIDTPASAFRIQEEEVEQVAWIPKAQLIREIKENPEKYTPAFPTVLELFC